MSYPGILPTANQLSPILGPALDKYNVVAVPFAQWELNTLANGGGSNTCTFQSAIGTNKGGSGTGYFCRTVQSSTSNGSVSIWGKFTGTAFGVTFANNTTTPPFSVAVDGDPVLIPAQDLFSQYETRAALYESRYLTHTELFQGEHNFQILLPQAPAIYNTVGGNFAGTTLTLTLTGLLLSQGAGYRQSYQEGTAQVVQSGTLTTSAAALCTTSASSSSVARFITGVTYYNSDVASRTVTIKSGSSIITVLTIAAGASSNFNFPGNAPNISVLTHQADAAGVVNATVFGSLGI